jgi:hypothetical protein
MEEYNRLFVEVYDYVKNSDIKYEALKTKIVSHEKENLLEKRKIFIRDAFNKNIGYYNDIIKKLDLTDLRYLFRFGQYVSENEIKTAEFLNKYYEDKIKKLSKSIADAMMRGYKVDQKDRKNRTAIKLMYTMGALSARAQVLLTRFPRPQKTFRKNRPT